MVLDISRVLLRDCLRTTLVQYHLVFQQAVSIPRFGKLEKLALPWPFHPLVFLCCYDLHCDEVIKGR